MRELTNDVREAWEGMNALLGQVVLSVTPRAHRIWTPETIVKPTGSHYIFTPEEVVEYGISLQTGPGRYANPDPRREDAINAMDVEEGPVFRNVGNAVRMVSRRGKDSSSRTDDYNNVPRYCLARLIQEGDAMKIWVATAMLAQKAWQTPMQHIGEVDGKPLIAYDYHVHSGHMAFGCKGKEYLVGKMTELGMEPTIVPDFDKQRRA
jgi:hypothetical protein